MCFFLESISQIDVWCLGKMLKFQDIIMILFIIIPHSLWTRLRYMWPKDVPNCPKLSGFFRCRGLILLELKETKLRCGISRTRWWFQFMLYFSPRKLREDFQFDYIILVFFRWVGSITNQRRLTWHLLEKKTHRLQRNTKEEVISRKQKTIGDVLLFSICLVDPRMNWKMIAICDCCFLLNRLVWCFSF